ncbi:nucleotidyltransferase domain-containing protein [Breznakiellaceae bacterium SP9]
MVTDLKTVKELAKQYSEEVRKAMSIDKVYLYGSYAKGTQREDSDVDICFFSSAFETRRRVDVLTELFHITRKYNTSIAIEPNAFPTSELENDNPFVKEILRTGEEFI